MKLGKLEFKVDHLILSCYKYFLSVLTKVS